MYFVRQPLSLPTRKYLLLLCLRRPLFCADRKGGKSSQRAVPFGNPCPSIHGQNTERPPEVLPRASPPSGRRATDVPLCFSNHSAYTAYKKTPKERTVYVSSEFLLFHTVARRPEVWPPYEHDGCSFVAVGAIINRPSRKQLETNKAIKDRKQFVLEGIESREQGREPLSLVVLRIGVSRGGREIEIPSPSGRSLLTFCRHRKSDPVRP